MRSAWLTASRLTVARTCQRKHYLEYEKGVRPVGRSRALAFGAALHEGLAAWWFHFTAEESERIELMLAHFRNAAEAEGLDSFDTVLGEELLIGYHFRWQADRWRTIAVEQPFDIPLRNPVSGHPSRTFRQKGKVDVIAENLDTGRVVVVEHKTAGGDISVGSDYWKRLTLDGQVSHYIDGARSLGLPTLDTVTYDVVAKPKLTPLKATPEADRKYTQKPSKLADGTVRPAGSLYVGQREDDETVDEFRARVTLLIAEKPSELYRRGDVTRLEDDLDEFRFDIWQVAEQVRESYNANRFPRNFDACWKYNSLCPYFPICTKETTEDDPTLYVHLDNVHPELDGSEPGAAKE